MNNQIDNIKSKTIKKLAQQCTTYHKVDFGMYEESGVDLEKFAELIVRECAKCVIFGEISAEPPYDRVIPALLEQLADDMKNHFGVK